MDAAVMVASGVDARCLLVADQRATRGSKGRTRSRPVGAAQAAMQEPRCAAGGAPSESGSHHSQGQVGTATASEAERCHSAAPEAEPFLEEVRHSRAGLAAVCKARAGPAAAAVPPQVPAAQTLSEDAADRAVSARPKLLCRSLGVRGRAQRRPRAARRPLPNRRNFAGSIRSCWDSCGALPESRSTMCTVSVFL